MHYSYELLTMVIHFGLVCPTKAFCFKWCIVHVKFFYHSIIELVPFSFVWITQMCSSEIYTCIHKQLVFIVNILNVYFLFSLLCMFSLLCHDRFRNQCMWTSLKCYTIHLSPDCRFSELKFMKYKVEIKKFIKLKKKWKYLWSKKKNL